MSSHTLLSMRSKTLERNRKDAQKDIGKRLRKSNPELWASLSAARQQAIISEYYHVYDLDKIGLASVLEHNRSLRMNFALLLIGLILGISGNLIGSILEKYIPSGRGSDLLIVTIFVIFIWLLIRMIDQLSAESLAEDQVLEHLVSLTADMKNAPGEM